VTCHNSEGMGEAGRAPISVVCVEYTWITPMDIVNLAVEMGEKGEIRGLLHQTVSARATLVTPAALQNRLR